MSGQHRLSYVTDVALKELQGSAVAAESDKTTSVLGSMAVAPACMGCGVHAPSLTLLGLLIRSHRFDRLQSVANTGCPMSQTVHVVYIYSSGSHQITKVVVVTCTVAATCTVAVTWP